MIKISLYALAIFSIPVLAFAEPESNKGIVYDIHDVVECLNANGQALIGVFDTKGQRTSTDFSITVREKPESTSKIVFSGTLTAYGHLKGQEANFVVPIKIIETGYEITSFPFFEKKNNWVKVEVLRPKRMFGWVETQPSGTVSSLKDLLFLHRTLYMTNSWDKKFSKAPDGKLDLVATWENADATMVDWKEINGKTWIELKFQTSVYGEGEVKNLGKGWTPLKNSEGRLNVWFASRD